MLSLANAFNEEDLKSFHDRILKNLGTNEQIDYFCEPKMDGAAVSLIYEKGILTRGSNKRRWNSWRRYHFEHQNH